MRPRPADLFFLPANENERKSRTARKKKAPFFVSNTYTHTCPSPYLSLVSVCEVFLSSFVWGGGRGGGARAKFFPTDAEREGKSLNNDLGRRRNSKARGKRAFLPSFPSLFSPCRGGGGERTLLPSLYPPSPSPSFPTLVEDEGKLKFVKNSLPRPPHCACRSEVPEYVLYVRSPSPNLF